MVTIFQYSFRSENFRSFLKCDLFTTCIVFSNTIHYIRAVQFRSRFIWLSASTYISTMVSTCLWKLEYYTNRIKKNHFTNRFAFIVLPVLHTNVHLIVLFTQIFSLPNVVFYSWHKFALNSSGTQTKFCFEFNLFFVFGPTGRRCYRTVSS